MAEMTVTRNGDDQVLQQEAYETNAVAPAVDIIEHDGGLIIRADMPGLEKDDIHVSTEKGILTIRGGNRQSEERDYNWREFELVSYFRQFRLGEKIDAGRIKAEYKQGVLELFLPMAEEAKPRQIEVKVK